MRYRRVILVLLFLFGIFVIYKAPGDPDFGWHYKYGEYLIKHRVVLQENIFSYNFPDYRWANSYLISQAFMYTSHAGLGHFFAGLLFSLPLSALGLLYVYYYAKKHHAGILLVCFTSMLLFVELSSTGVSGRPMYFSVVFLILLILILLERTNLLYVLPLLFLVWANTHADFTLGLFILGLYILDTLFTTPILTLDRKKALVLLLGPSSILITLLNPFGFELWRTLLKEAHPYQFSHIIEWVPIDTGNTVAFVFDCATLAIAVSALFMARRRLPTWYIVALGLFCIFALRSQYFLRVVVILSIPAVLAFWSQTLSDLQRVISPTTFSKLQKGLLAFLTLSTLAASAIFYSEVWESVDSKSWIEKQAYPKDALDYALQNRITGNVFNYYGWGGYMIWKYPKIKTFIDGRMPSWREGKASVFEDYIKIIDQPQNNIQILNDYNVRWVLYPKNADLSKYLRKANMDWKEIYSDDTASIFVIISP